MFWVSLSYSPTPEEQTKYSFAGKEIDEVFQVFINACVPKSAHVYGRLCTTYDVEYHQMIDDLHKAKIATEQTRGILGRLFGGDPRCIFVGDVDPTQILSFYKSYGGWVMNPYEFLVSEKPVNDWLTLVKHLEDKVLRKEFLRSVGGYLFNHYELGMEFIGFESKAETLEMEARSLSARLKVPVDVKRAKAGS